jgi:hypothetical protein
MAVGAFGSDARDVGSSPDSADSATGAGSAASAEEAAPERRRWWWLPTDRSAGWWVAPVYLVMSLATLPYVVLLATTLPDRVVSHNYRLTWVGFDVLLILSMARTAWLAWHRSPFVVNVASATATLLLVDAWFDVTTSPRQDVVTSFLLAIFVEIPAALLSLGIAGRAQIQIARTGAVRRHGETWRLMQRFDLDGESSEPGLSAAPSGPQNTRDDDLPGSSATVP